MILSARLVLSNQRKHHCDECYCELEEPYLRIYGMGDFNDKPRMLRLHFNCSNFEMDTLKLSKWEWETIMLNEEWWKAKHG